MDGSVEHSFQFQKIMNVRLCFRLYPESKPFSLQQIQVCVCVCSVYMFMCSYVGYVYITWVPMYMHKYILVCRDQRASIGCFPQLLSSFLFETVSLSEPGAHWLVISGKQAIGTLLSLPPAMELQACATMSDLLHVCQRFELKCFHLGGKAFVNGAISPAPLPHYEFYSWSKEQKKKRVSIPKAWICPSVFSQIL